MTGSSLVQFSLVVVFLFFHLALSIGAHRANPSRLTRQAIATYTIWIVFLSAVIGAVITNPDYRWNEKETGQLVTAGILTVAIVLTAAVLNRGVTDPMIKAWFAIAYKSVPQALLAWKFLSEGASGTPGLSVFIGHATILIRLGQIGLIVREGGWNRNLVWLTVSEALNEFSWLAATAAWIFMI